jgi:hypothetical protein
MTTKLKIDVSQGILEVEGSESFVKVIYNDFKTHFVGIDTAHDLTPARRGRKVKAAEEFAAEVSAEIPAEPEVVIEPAIGPVISEAVVETPPSKPEPPAPVYNLIKDLELGAGEGHASLVEFMDSKFPLTNEERNIVFLYHLQQNLKLKAITPDYIYTCYKQARIRVPLNLDNSLHITDQRGWIKTTKNGYMQLTSAGKVYVEQQLPKKVKPH